MNSHANRSIASRVFQSADRDEKKILIEKKKWIIYTHKMNSIDLSKE